MLEPTPEETPSSSRALGIEMPTREEMREIEASARVYEEVGASFLTATMLVNSDRPPPAKSEITFVLLDERLVTQRYATPSRSAHAGADRAPRRRPGQSGLAVFFWLVDVIVARAADVLERASVRPRHPSGAIFGAATNQAPSASARPPGGAWSASAARATPPPRSATACSRCRASPRRRRHRQPAGTAAQGRPRSRQGAPARRRLAHRPRHLPVAEDQLPARRHARHDHIEQNAIIKIFSVAAVVFLPPTLIASIYGMNFDLIPELHWRYGYPFALLLMVLSACVPFLYFSAAAGCRLISATSACSDLGRPDPGPRPRRPSNGSGGGSRVERTAARRASR